MFCNLVFVYFSIIALVNCTSFRQGVAPPKTCETKECHDAADHIKKWMNPAFKPCDDFYEFSCGYWHSADNKTINKQHSASLGSRGELFAVHLKTFILDEAIDKESQLFQMAREFLNVCLDEESIKARGVSPAVDYMRKVGGWPVLEKDWSEDRWDLLRTEIQFGGVFFRMQTTPTMTDSTTHLGIYPKYTSNDYFEDLIGGLQKESVQKYFKEKCELAELFGADKSRVEAEMMDTLKFEIAMSELNAGLSEAEGFRTYNLSLLQSEIGWINWTELISATLPESMSLRDNQTIYVISPDYIRELGSLINKYPKRTIANYMMSKAASPLKKYLPPSVYNSTGDVNTTRFDMCAQFVQASSLSGIVAAYIARQTLEETKVAQEITQHVLDELILEVKEIQWFDEKTRSVAIKLLQETDILISFPDEILSMDAVTEIYKEVKVNNSHFFEAMMDSNRWMSKQKFRHLGESAEVLTLQDKIEASLDINAYFMMIGNQIVVSAGFLQFIPLFHPKVPSYINYGHLGSIIAHELTHALDFQADYTEDRMEDTDLQQVMLRWGSNATEEIYDEKKQCIIDQYSSFNDTKYTGRMLNGSLTDREDVADNGGLKLALRAYRKFAAQLSAPEPKLPGLQQYSDEQLFLISVANTFCEIPTAKKLLRQLNYDSHSPFEFRIKGMMMNSPDFSKLFNCKKGDPMDPKKKCEVW